MLLAFQMLYPRLHSRSKIEVSFRLRAFKHLNEVAKRGAVKLHGVNDYLAVA